MRFYGFCLVALLGGLVAWGQEQGRPSTTDGVEVLTRGPIHEAFAETISFDPEPGVIVAKAPPEAIDELPPEQKPDGANVAWIPGYWGWDDERNDFLWISGVWRALPPGRQWMPGYWGQTERGYQWISGYWTDAQASDVEYLPEPPATVEEGPNVAAPSADHTWVPGCWVWSQSRYAWRPGYWVVAVPNWVWIPAHYHWCPRGYVFIDGYYDYAVARRGVLFAPVYFSSAVYRQPDYVYSPVTVINPAVFVSHLFLRPSFGHYYFGDYYDSSYATRGFSPWFVYHSSRVGYDPFYAHQHWSHRHDRDWDRRVEADYAHRRDHEEARPPHTWIAQRESAARDAASGDKTFVVAASLDDLVKVKENPLRLQPVDKLARQQLGERGQNLRTASEERQKLEVDAASPSTEPSNRTTKPVKVKLPKTPIASQPVDRLGRDDAPPQRIEPPQPDSKVEPKARKPRSTSGSPLDPNATSREPRPGRPKVEPEPNRPRVEPRPETPKIEPKPDRPRGEPRPELPKVEPKPDRPRGEPRPELPKVEPKPGRPQVEPRPELPKVEPKPDRPQVEPRPELPKVEPKPGRPQVEPRPELPKVEPKPGRPQGKPGPEAPKAPRPERPKEKP